MSRHQLGAAIVSRAIGLSAAPGASARGLEKHVWLANLEESPDVLQARGGTGIAMVVLGSVVVGITITLGG